MIDKTNDLAAEREDERKKRAIDTLDREGMKKIMHQRKQWKDSSYKQENFLDRRWIWELIQNTKDVCEVGDKTITICFKEEQDTVEFIYEHTGRNFSLIELEHLINGWSTKLTTTPETTGEFGTGFFLTHLISETLLIKGVFEHKDKEFDFEVPIIRCSEKKEIAEAEEEIRYYKEKSISILDHSSSEVAKRKTTVFHYKKLPIKNVVEGNKIFDNTQNTSDFVGGVNKDIVEIGLHELDVFIKYVLVTMKKITTIIIDNKISNEKTTYSLKSLEEPLETTNNFHSIVKMQKEGEKSSEKSLFTKKSSNKDEEVVILWEAEAREEYYHILPFEKNTAKIFIDLPLLGTEGYFPVILNSNKFSPLDQKRNNISFDDTSENKNLLDIAKNLYKDLIIECSQKKSQWKDVYNLVCMPLKLDEDPKKKLMKKYIDELHDIIKRHLIVDTNKGEREEILKVKIFDKKDKEIFDPQDAENFNKKGVKKDDKKEKKVCFWDLCNRWADITIPIKEEYIGWATNLPEDIERFRLGDLAQLVEKCKTMDGLKVALLGEKVDEDEKAVFKWLNDFYQLIIDSKKDKLFNEYTIILNQEGTLEKIEDLYLDKIEDKIYKEIFTEEIVIDFKGILIDKHLDVLYKDYTESSTLSIRQIDNKEIIEGIFSHINTKISKKDTSDIILLCIKILHIQEVGIFHKRSSVQDKLIELLEDYYKENNKTSFSKAKAYFLEGKKERTRDKIKSKIDVELLKQSIFVLLDDCAINITKVDFSSYFTPLDDVHKIISLKAISWLNKFIEYLYKHIKEETIGEKCKGILDTTGIFLTRNNELKMKTQVYASELQTGPISDNFIEIAKSILSKELKSALNSDLNTILLHKDMNLPKKSLDEGNGLEGVHTYLKQENHDIPLKISDWIKTQVDLNKIEDDDKPILVQCQTWYKHHRSEAESLIGDIGELLKSFDKDFKNIELEKEIEKLKKETNSDKYNGVHKYLTTKNNLVISKSEVIIANILHSYDISYEYEEKYDIKRPDFTIDLGIVGVEILWEHFGVVGSPKYEADKAIKISYFEGEGFKKVDLKDDNPRDEEYIAGKLKNAMESGKILICTYDDDYNGGDIIGPNEYNQSVETPWFDSRYIDIVCQWLKKQKS